MRLSDAELVRLLKNHDESAFEELINRYSNKVYYLALRLIKNKSDAEDIAQEVFISVFSKIDDLREDNALSSWLYRITVNASMTMVRAYSHLDETLLEEDLPRFTPEGRHYKTIKDWSKNPEEKVLSNEILGYVEENIKELPLPHRLVILLRDVEGLTSEEVAEILDISIAAVKSRLHRSRLFLRERLSRYFEGETK